MKNETAGWIFFADNDIFAAQTLMAYAESAGNAAFHCQQAIEKYFKAYLVENDKEIRRTHDLESLYYGVKSIQDWGLDEQSLEKINSLYTEVRYPGNLAINPGGLLPSAEEAQRYLDFAHEVKAAFKMRCQ